jgi:hypothetical protein
MKQSNFRYLIARNKITRLVDVIDTKLGKVVSRDHKNRDQAEAVAAKLLRKEPDDEPYDRDGYSSGSDGW